MTADRPVPGGLHSGCAIAGGRADADRLGRQADVMAASTAALLIRDGLRSGGPACRGQPPQRQADRVATTAGCTTSARAIAPPARRWSSNSVRTVSARQLDDRHWSAALMTPRGARSTSEADTW